MPLRSATLPRLRVIGRENALALVPLARIERDRFRLLEDSAGYAAGEDPGPKPEHVRPSVPWWGREALALSHTGRLLSMLRPDGFQCWDLRTGTLRAGPDAEGRVVALSHDGRWVAVRTDDRLEVRDLATGVVSGAAIEDEWVRDVALAPGGTALVLVGSEDSEDAVLWDVRLRARRVIDGFASGLGLIFLGFSPTGEHVVFCSQIAYHGRGVKALSAATGRAVNTWQFHESHVSVGAVSPDGQRLALGGEMGNVGIWPINEASSRPQLTSDFRVPESQVRVPPLPDAVMSLTFAPSGKLCVSGTAAGHIALWDASSGDVLRMSPPCGQALLQVASSGDQTTLAALANDGSVAIWGVPEEEEHPPAWLQDTLVGLSPSERVVAEQFELDRWRAARRPNA